MATERVTRYVRLVIDASGAKSGGREVKKALDDINSSVKRTAANMDGLRNVFAGAFAYLGVQELISYADTWNLITGRLIIATGSAEAAAVAQERLLNIANSARAPLESTAALYARLANATKELGTSQEDIARATEAVALSFRVGGASSSEAAAAAIQLAQGLGSGALQGDELRSVLENNIPLAQVIAKEFGVTVGQLRDLGSEGKLTAERVIPAIVASLDTFRAQAATIPETIGGAFAVLKNEFMALIGSFAASTGITTAISNAIIFFAQNLDSVAIFLAVLSTTAIPAVIAGVQALTVAIAANPIGLIAVAVASAVVALYELRDATISFGGETATVGSIIAVVWEGIKLAITAVGDAFVWVYDLATQVYSNMTSAGASFFESVKSGLDTFLDNWGISLDAVLGWIRSAINAYIGLFVGLVAAIGPTITEGIPALFALAMATARNLVISGIESIINAVARGLGAIGGALDNIPGIDGVGAGITKSLSVDLSGLRADTAGLTAEMKAAGAAITGAFSGAQVDYVGAFGEAVTGTGAKLRDVATDVVAAAAELDRVANPTGPAGAPVPGAPAAPGAPAVPGAGAGGGAGGGGGSRKQAIDEETASLAKMHAELDKGIELARMSNSEREIEVELRRMLDELAKAGIEVSAQEVEVLRDKVAAYQNLQKIQGDILSASEILFDGFNKFLDGAADAIVEFGRTGKFEIKSLVGDILAQMAKLALNSIFKQLFGGLIGGGAGGGGGFLGKLLGFAQGGEFTVGGGGGTDSKLVAFRASPGERVTVDRPDQDRRGGGAQNIKVVNVIDPRQALDALKTTAGERLILNTIERNPGAVRALLSR